MMLTWWFLNRPAITATNSTCANRLPGQLRRPFSQRKYVPFSEMRRRSSLSWTSRSSGCIDPHPKIEDDERIHRWGRQTSESSP
jgi:hypothetical protein